MKQHYPVFTMSHLPLTSFDHQGQPPTFGVQHVFKKTLRLEFAVALCEAPEAPLHYLFFKDDPVTDALLYLCPKEKNCQLAHPLSYPSHLGVQVQNLTLDLPKTNKRQAFKENIIPRKI